MKRKHHTKNFKAKVALAAIKGQKTTNEIASEFGIHVIQVNRWKKEALETLPKAFGCKKYSTIKEMVSERNHLFQDKATSFL
jgi:transposase